MAARELARQSLSAVRDGPYARLRLAQFAPLAPLVVSSPSKATVVVHTGAAWWVPVLTSIAVTVVAAVGAYIVAWRFKRSDVNRENAFRAAELVDEAERRVALRTEDAQTGHEVAVTAGRLLKSARIRTQPLHDSDLDDRLTSAIYWADEVAELQSESSKVFSLLGDAVVSVRIALVPYLAAPSVARRRHPDPPCFPKSQELFAMQNRTKDFYGFLNEVSDWRVRYQRERDAKRT